jgi:hypothetical protein
MTTHIGNAGVVRIATNAIGEMTGFTVTETGGTAEDTALGDTAKTFLADALPTWTASINAHYDPADTNGQVLIVAGASLVLEFHTAGTGTGKKKLTGTGIVTQVQFGEVSNGGVVPFSAEFQGTGALARGTNS